MMNDSLCTGKTTEIPPKLGSAGPRRGAPTATCRRQGIAMTFLSRRALGVDYHAHRGWGCWGSRGCVPVASPSTASQLPLHELATPCRYLLAYAGSSTLAPGVLTCPPAGCLEC